MNVPHVDEIGTDRATRELAEQGLRPVLMTEALAQALADRVEWGQPDARGWYTPTFYRTEYRADHTEYRTTLRSEASE